MNAILSGRSARALILDGESLKSFDLDDPSTIVPRRRSDLPYLFGEAADLRILENTTIEVVKRELRKDCHFTWALDLVLISLDSELEDDIRKEALEELEKLFAENSTVILVENVLYSEPLPEDADLTNALELCGDHALNTVRIFLQRLEASQGLIEKTNQAWESIPTKVFGNHENRKSFKHTAVKEGLFRNLVTLDPSDPVYTLFLKTAFKESVQQLPNHRQVLQAWSALVDETTNQDPENVTAKAERAKVLEFVYEEFDTLIRRYHRLLKLAAARILRNSETADAQAEDIVQEVFIIVCCEGIKDVGGPIDTYLMRMVRDKALSRRGRPFPLVRPVRPRRVRKRSVDVERDETLEDILDFAAEFERKENSDWLDQHLSGMSLEDQLVFHLRSDGLSWEQIAEALDISEGTAKSSFYSARAILWRARQRSINTVAAKKSQPSPHADRKTTDSGK